MGPESFTNIPAFLPVLLSTARYNNGTFFSNPSLYSPQNINHLIFHITPYVTKAIISLRYCESNTLLSVRL